MKVLFIGGDADGEWLDINHPETYPVYNVARKGPLPFIPFTGERINTENLNELHQVYIREIFRSYQGDDIIVYVLEGLGNPMLALINGYRKPV